MPRQTPNNVPTAAGAPLTALCLTRRLNESIELIDDASGELLAEITPVRIKGGNVRLLVRAPRSTGIIRGELQRQIFEAFTEEEIASDDRAACDPHAA